MNIFHTNKSFWDSIESDICYKVPNYIKNMLTFCNYGNVLSLQKFDIGDIIKIEQMVKDQFKQWLQEKLEMIDFLDYFGPVYDTKPEQFRFSCGDIRMIQKIAEHVQIKVQKKGYQHFDGVISHFGTDHRETINDADEEMREKLYNAVLDLLKPYGKEVVSNFKKDMVEVTTEGDVIKGRIRCILCDMELRPENSKRRRTKEFYQQYWNGHSWVVSNFSNRHLKKIHSFTTSQISQESNHSEEQIDMDDASESIGESPSDKDRLSERKIIGLKIEPVNIVSEELNNILAQLQIHKIQMINTFKNMKDGTECEVELRAGKISKILVCPVPGDGNCLFGAIVHQHFHLDVGSDQYIQQVNELRQKVVAHIRANLQRFEYRLMGRIYAKRAQIIEKKEQIQNVEEEVKNFLENHLAKDGNWAVKKVLKQSVNYSEQT